MENKEEKIVRRIWLCREREKGGFNTRKRKLKNQVAKPECSGSRRVGTKVALMLQVWEVERL